MLLGLTIRDVVLIDLADKKRISERVSQIRQTCEILSMPHGLDVPVGIGFSLLMFPALKDTVLWKELSHSAKQSLISAKEDLAEVGIELLCHSTN